MTFRPVLPSAGYSGWLFLQRTRENQQALLSASPATRRNTEYFAERIGDVQTATDLVSDRRLLTVALGAFGLQADIGNRYFVRRVLEDGSADPDALSNRLADKRYRAFSEAFGFGGDRMQQSFQPGFAQTVIQAYETQQFEVAVGEEHADLRLALTAQRELIELASSGMSDDAKWFSVMGSPPLRNVFETAFGLPGSFGTLDLDFQADTFREKAESQFGDGEISQFSDPDRLEGLLRRFLVRSELAEASSWSSSGSIALALLSTPANG